MLASWRCNVSPLALVWSSVNEGGEYLRLFVYDLNFFSAEIIWIICEKCSLFSSRLYEFIWNRGLFSLIEIIQDYCKLFVGYLFCLKQGLFDIIWNRDSLRLLVSDYLRLFETGIICGLYVDYLDLVWIICRLFEIGIIWDYLQDGLFENTLTMNCFRLFVFGFLEIIWTMGCLRLFVDYL